MERERPQIEKRVARHAQQNKQRVVENLKEENYYSRREFEKYGTLFLPTAFWNGNSNND